MGSGDSHNHKESAFCNFANENPVTSQRDWSTILKWSGVIPSVDILYMYQYSFTQWQVANQRGL